MRQFAKFFLVILFSGSLYAQYINVFVEVTAPKEWHDSITEGLTTKLNAIPDVQVVKDPADAAFTVSVDVNSVTSGKNDAILGYSMMALIYGTYDRTVLNAIFDSMWGESKDPQTKQLLALVKYTTSGNIFLAGTVHTHGPLDAISDAYDMIVGKIKTTGLPELRQFRKLIDQVSKSPTPAAPKPLPSRF